MLINVTAFTIVFKLISLHVTSLFVCFSFSSKSSYVLGFFSLLANLPVPLVLISVTEKRFSCINGFSNICLINM